MELLKEVAPEARRVAYLYTPRTKKRIPRRLKQTEAAGMALGVKILRFPVASLVDFERAFTVMKNERPDALLTAGTRIAFYHKERIIAFANSLNVPIICTRVEVARAGCLLAYVPDRSHMMRRAAVFVDKILKGANPGDLPVERPTRFRLVINLKTAKALGITVPPSILLRATEVIE